MLVRVCLVLHTNALQKRLRDLHAGLDVLVSLAPVRGNFWNRLSHENSDFILVSRGLIPEPLSHSISLLRELPDRPEVVVLCDRENAAERAEMLAAGCLAVLYEGLPDAVLAGTLRTLVARRSEWQAGMMGRQRPERQAQLDDFVSTSPAMQAFVEMARCVVGSDSSLLLLGETGVGKERLARAVHNESPRSAGPFIAVNCAAMPETLLESELFGHEEGAFTGATRPRRGYFELAHRGTLFLDEIGEMPPHVQVKLLRVLQEYEIQRLGSERSVPVDVRVMAATNRDLEEAVEARQFRRDLYYRLAVVTLTIPALRERREDIPDLVESYIAHFNARLGRHIEGVSAEVLQALRAYSWPGNVRELINVMERAVLLCSGRQITRTELPQNVVAAVPSSGFAATAADSAGSPGPCANGLVDKPWPEARREMLEDFERAYLSALLTRTGGRIGETARLAGIQPRSLFQKMRRHGLRKEDFKPKSP